MKISDIVLAKMISEYFKHTQAPYKCTKHYLSIQMHDVVHPHPFLIYT